MHSCTLVFPVVQVLELSCLDDYTVARCSNGKLYIMYYPPVARQDNGQKFYMCPAELGDGAHNGGGGGGSSGGGGGDPGWNTQPTASQSYNQWPSSTHCAHWKVQALVNLPPGDEVILGVRTRITHKQ